MNKELINKYKTEFDHWLKGGEILYKHKNSLAWWTNDCWDYSSNYVVAIIIKDKDIEFRKALAEGKTVQRRNGYGFEWKDSGEQDMLNYSIDNLRIKPEESQLKKGDWVRNSISRHDIGKVEEFTSEGYSKTVCLTHNGHCFLQWEPWEPQPGEWCWYSKWDKIVCVESYLCKYALDMNEVEPEYKHKYEPFIGQLPSYLKE